MKRCCNLREGGIGTEEEQLTFEIMSHKASVNNKFQTMEMKLVI